MPHLSKKHLILSTLILALSLGLFGCLKKPAVSTNQNTNQLVNQNQNGDTLTATSTAEIDTSDWKTYRNEEYGFEFKYPPSLFIKKGDYYADILFNDILNINIDILNEGIDPKTIKSPIGIVTEEVLEKITIGGKLSYRFIDGDMRYGGYSYRIPLSSEHTLFMWFVTDGGYFTDEERNIISTFRFIK